jgi:hypothetical protein
MDKPVIPGVDPNMGNSGRASCGNEKHEITGRKFRCLDPFGPGIETFASSRNGNIQAFPETEEDKAGTIQAPPVKARVAVGSAQAGFSRRKEFEPGFRCRRALHGSILDGDSGKDTGSHNQKP